MDEVEAVKVFNKTLLTNCQKSGRRNENGKTIIEYSIRTTQPSDQEWAWQQDPFQSDIPPPSMEYCEVLFFLLTHFFQLS